MNVKRNALVKDVKVLKNNLICTDFCKCTSCENDWKDPVKDIIYAESDDYDDDD